MQSRFRCYWPPLYSDGDGLPRNEAVAHAWFKLAAAGGRPAAMERLSTPGASDLTFGLKQDDTLRSAIPVAPRPGTAIAPGDLFAEIVWSAPAERLPVRYFLEVVTRNEGNSREIYAGYLDVTATLVRLDTMHHAYAWRVYTVSPRSASYAVSAWIPFTTRDTASR